MNSVTDGTGEVAPLGEVGVAVLCGAGVAGEMTLPCVFGLSLAFDRHDLIKDAQYSYG